MPILLPEDLKCNLPEMRKVRQSFSRERIDDLSVALKSEMSKTDIRSKIKPGDKVAVAVGSRGIHNLSFIVKDVLENITSAGGEPFILSAMGSHGSGTEEGQREILKSYGITENAMGVPVITKTDVERIGKTSRGIDVYFDKTALSSDVIVPVNRVKLHTDFVGDIQSGLCKMLVIGLGNHIGCAAIHEVDFDTFGDTLLEAADIILKKTKVGFGVAIVENAYDETLLVEAVPCENFVKREKELLKIAKENMPAIMIPEIDVLIVKEIGKNISGAGYDPNIVGRSYILKEFVLPVPRVKRMVLLDVSEQSHGNALGMGPFDVITRKVYEQLDLESIYTNAVAIKCIDDAKIPLIASDEEEAVRIAAKTLRGVDRRNLKIVKIKNTKELDIIEVSEALLPYVESHEKLSII